MTSTGTSEGGNGQLLRAIGYFGVAVLALNSVIGGGIFGLPARVVERAGLASPWLFLVVSLLVITIVLTFAELASYFRDSGGPVLFTTRAFGPYIGFGTGWIYYISRITAFAANASLLADYVGSLWSPAAAGIGRATIITLVCSGLTWANYVGVKDGVRTLSVLTLLKIVPVIVLILAALPYVSVETVIPQQMPVIDDPGGTVLLMIFAFVGFEATTIVSGESKDPRRSLPRALVSTTIFIGLFYFFVVLTYVATLPSVGGNQGTLVAMGEYLLGPVGAIAITLAAVFSMGGNLGAILLAVPRLTFGLAEQHMLPKWFRAVHPKYATPGNSILFLGGISLLLALSGSFAFLAVASSLTRLITYILCISALPIIRRAASGEDLDRVYRLKGGYTIPAIALLVSIGIAAQSGRDEWQLTGGLFALGLVLFGIAQFARRRRNVA
ncbi:MAG: APC family permease [Gammaproteobacteria bacterium]|nr:APC family permease [Gammaproteobacteria bacterium]